MLDGKECRPAMVEAERVKEVVTAIAESQQRTLNTKQKSAIEQILSSRDQIIGLQGGAGTGRKRLLIITLTVFTVLVLVFAVVLPAIALSILDLSVMRERAARPPQTSVPSLVGLNYESAEPKVRESNLNIRMLAHRYDVPNEPCTIIFQTPQAGERLSYGTVVGVVVSNSESDKAKQCSSH